MEGDKQKPSEILSEGRKIEREHWKAVFEAAKDDPFLMDAIDMIRHLHDQLMDGAKPLARYEPALIQWLNVHDQLIEHVDEFSQIVTSRNVKKLPKPPVE